MAPLLYYIKLYASFQIHWWIETGVTVWKCSIRVKIGEFFCPGWLWKLMYDLEKQQGISSILRQALCIISNPLVKSNLSYSLETPSQVKIGDFFVLRDLENWLMTLQNNRAPLLCCFNLCASFHSQWWIQTGVIVWKRPNWLKIDNFFSCVTLKFDGWPWRTIGYLF